MAHLFRVIDSAFIVALASRYFYFYHYIQEHQVITDFKN